jgi:predicted ABC-type ATPase
VAPLPETLPLDRRPIVIAIAGPNGAGKTTFYRAHIAHLELAYVNADDLAREFETDAYESARLAAAYRTALLAEKESFVFETVFSDPAGEKLAFLRDAAARGYTVVLIFIGIASVALSEARVIHRVTNGGHDVPTEKLEARFPRTLDNLRRAVRELPQVLLFDNSDEDRPFRAVASFDHGALVDSQDSVPAWARQIVKAQ